MNHWDPHCLNIYCLKNKSKPCLDNVSLKKMRITSQISKSMHLYVPNSSPYKIMYILMLIRRTKEISKEILGWVYKKLKDKSTVVTMMEWHNIF